MKQNKKQKNKNNVRTLESCIVLLTCLFILLVGFSLIPLNAGTEPSILTLLGANLGIPINRMSPYDFIKEEQIEIYPDRVIIRIPGAVMSRYSSTGSMDPIFDFTANGIEIPFTNRNQIHVGDIIAFHPNPESDEFIVHRVIEIDYDENGWYCVTKGDNNTYNDGKIREEQIKFITVMIIY